MRYFSSPSRLVQHEGTPINLFNGYRVFFHPAIKRPVREVTHSTSPNAEVKNEWSYTSTLSIRPHGVVRENVTNFTLVQGRPLGGASGALAPGADFEGAPKGRHRPATR
jgi:hypothetical protein